LSGIFLKQLGTEFIPVLDEGSISMDVSMAPSISLDEAERTIQRVNAELLQVKGIREAVAMIGRPEAGGHPHPVNFAMVHIELDQPKEKQRIIDELRVRLKDYPGMQVNFSQPIQHLYDEMLSGSRAQLAIKVYGEDLDQIHQTAESIRTSLEGVDGLVDLSVEQNFGQPQIQVILNHDALARYNVPGEKVLQQVESAVGGEVISTLYRNTRRYSIQIRLAPEYRSTPKQLEELFIRSEDGALLRLSQLAEIRNTDGPLQINRENNQRRWIVQGNIRNRALSAVLEEIKTTIASKVDIPSGVFIEYGGQFEQQRRAMHRLAVIVPIVIGLIFILLWITFHSIRHAAMIILCVPMALIGGVVGLWVTNQYLSVPASIGFIALFGAAMQDAMVLLTDYNDLRKEGQTIQDAVVNGGIIRFRSVLMTTLTTLLGLAPLLISRGAGAEVQRPLAAVVIFGLITSTFLTLFVLPAIYVLIEQRIEKKRTATAS
ncbi:MAG: efflux RND transporter permease subunit, partial [Kiritimatiellaceae bacterium]|nr:efflux RND transporter permease subunit [Kiritimatiellaceae bacterium]